jgi:hypothetical protein
MTETFRALLAAIFPASPALWLKLLLQWLVGRLANVMETRFDELDHNPRSRAWFAAGIAYAEDGVALLIGQRTRELMGLRFRIQRNWRLPRPTTPPTFEQLIARWISLLESLDHIERIAKRRAERLLAEREADPLGLNDDDPGLVAIIITPATPLASLCWQDGLARRSVAKAAGGRASARGPPHRSCQESVTRLAA